MDSIVFAALEEICSQGANGLALQSLWPNLHAALSSAGLDLSSGVKAAIWANLLKTPGLEFQSRNVSRNADDPAIQSVEQCEKLNLKIVAAEHLRDSFVGLYDVKASAVTGISAVQRRVLERLAIARSSLDCSGTRLVFLFSQRVVRFGPPMDRVTWHVVLSGTSIRIGCLEPAGFLYFYTGKSFIQIASCIDSITCILSLCKIS